MKQLTDDLQDRVIELLVTSLHFTPSHEPNIAIDAQAAILELRALPDVPIAQPVPEVNAVLVRALETLTNNCKGCCPSKAEIGNAALTAAKQAQPEPNKAALIGEFSFTIPMRCNACTYNGIEDDCEVCSGEVEYDHSVTVPWTTIKAIIAAHQRTVQQAQPSQYGSPELQALILDKLQQAQPERAPLSDDEIQTIYLRTYNEGFHGRNLEIAFARAIEAAIKQGGQQ